MHTILKSIGHLIFFCCISLSYAQSSSSEWFTQDQAKQIKLRVNLFLSSSCPYCHQADNFFKEQETKLNWLDVHRYIVDQDKAALYFFYQQLERQSLTNFAVPSIFFCDSHWVGFANNQDSGKELLRALNYCYQQITTVGYLSPAARDVLRQQAIANWYYMYINKSAALLFIPTIALIDSLNPCALFVVLAMFAFLYLAPSKRLQWELGASFFVAMVGMHWIQQVKPSLFYFALPWLFIPVILLGLGLLFYLYWNYYKGSKQPVGLTWFLASLVIIATQIYQQTCQPNIALIFQQWLDAKSISLGKNLIYQTTYQVIYSLPLILLILGFIFLPRAKRLEKYQVVLSYSAQLILVVIAGFFIFYPHGLSSFISSLVVQPFALLGGWLLAKRKPQPK